MQSNLNNETSPGELDINNKFKPNPQLKGHNPRITSMSSANRGTLHMTQPSAQKSNVSYSDILNSLNMQVQDGKLVITRPTTTPDSTSTSMSSSIPSNNSSSDKSNKINNMFSKSTTHIPNKYISDSYPPSIPSPITEPAKPLTKEQYLKQRREYYINKLREQKRINNIKSTKLRFSNTENIPITPIKSSVATHNLFRFHK
jgi:hypothetical protein